MVTGENLYIEELQQVMIDKTMYVENTYVAENASCSSSKELR